MRRGTLGSLAWMVALTALAGPLAAADEVASGADDRRDLAITIYNENLALVRDVRRIALDKGERRLAFADVSAQIRPQTAALSGDGLRVLEQNFDFDLLTPAALLKKAVGETVKLYRPNPTTGADRVEDAEVLSAAGGGVVLRIGDRIETISGGDFPGRVVFEKIPPNLRARPTLSMTLAVEKAGARELELAYLTRGLSWTADYVGRLSADEQSLRLTGLVTLTNRAGTGFDNALVQLVAGDVNQVADKAPAPEMQGTLMRTMAAAPDVAQQALADYHLYTLGRRTSVADNQTKQVSFLTAPKVKTEKTYRYRSYGFPSHDQAQSVAVEFRFDNQPQSGLGMPLPKGVVRIYAQDQAGRAQFIGEDAIDHTPKGDQVTLQLGRAFDVKVKGRLVADEVIARSRESITREITQDYVLTNAKATAVTVTLDQRIPGDWTLLSESQDGETVNADLRRYRIAVPAEGETRLRFALRIKQ